MPMVATGPAGRGVRLHCEEHGDGAPILCVHGAGSSAVLWGDAVARLARHGSVIAYDRRGCGRSGRPEGYAATTVTEQADDAAAVLAALADGPAVVVGRSFGGWVAMELALRHPGRVRALALLEPDAPGLAPAADAWVAGLEARLRAVARARGDGAVGEALIAEVAGPDAWDALPGAVRDVLTGNGPAVLAELRAYEGAVLDAAALDRAGAPLLLVAAEDSPPEVREPVVALAAAVPRARLERVPGGHLIDPAAPEVLAFVDEVLARGAGVEAPGDG